MISAQVLHCVCAKRKEQVEMRLNYPVPTAYQDN